MTALCKECLAALIPGVNWASYVQARADYRCRTCLNEYLTIYHREWRRQNPDLVRAAQRRWRATQRARKAQNDQTPETNPGDE